MTRRPAAERRRVPRRACAPGRGERGAGLVASVGGLLVFLLLLTVGTHLLVGLHARSEVTSAAYDAARRVATSPSPDAEVAVAEVQAQRRMGGIGDTATFDWDLSGDQVRLRIRADSPSFLLPLVSDGLGVESVDRTVTVRIERPVGAG